MPPWRIQHESHTCSELSLRILLWSASYAKTLPLNLTGVSHWKDPKNSEICHRHSQWKREKDGSWPFPFNKAISLSTWQIAKTVQVKGDIKSKSSDQSQLENCLKIDMPVLGLAGCHITEKRKLSKWSCKLCLRHPCQDLQVQVNDQFTLPPSYHSFVAPGRYDGPDAPAETNYRMTNENRVEVLHYTRARTSVAPFRDLPKPIYSDYI